jgi:hypothetical protein
MSAISLISPASFAEPSTLKTGIGVIFYGIKYIYFTLPCNIPDYLLFYLLELDLYSCL